jgi:hypothetical protein
MNSNGKTPSPGSASPFIKPATIEQCLIMIDLLVQ